MTIDGIILRAIVNELREKLLNGRVQKINQINKNLVLLGIYSNKNHKLLLSVDSQAPRIHLTNKDFDSPQTPSNFTMILRKHLNNSRLKEINQVGLDRTVEFIFDARNELGVLVELKLIVDLMGKHSNIVLIDENKKVIESIIRVSHDMSRVRAIYPGTIFEKLQSDKIDISPDNLSLNNLVIADNLKIFKIFYTYFNGFSPIIGREIAYNADLEPSRPYGSLSEIEKTKLNNEFKNISLKILSDKVQANHIFQDNKLFGFYSFKLNHLCNDTKDFDSISEAVDEYYVLNTNDDSLNQSRKNVINQLEKIITKRANKLDLMHSDQEKAKEHDKYRIEGELLSANIYLLKRGMKSINLLNYYDNSNIDISLDEKKDGWQNVEKKYKISKKLKKSFNMLSESIPQVKSEINYLKELVRQLEGIESHEELDEIRDELILGQYIKPQAKKKKKTSNKPSKPMKYQTIDNSIILVGKNNKQNELITLKEASKEDYFFHVKDLPGSHVILKNDSSIFSQEDIHAAAYLAAKNSKYSEENYLDIDYTKRKNVFKLKGAKPGMVYYNDFSTIRIDLNSDPKNYRKIED